MMNLHKAVGGLNSMLESSSIIPRINFMINFNNIASSPYPNQNTVCFKGMESKQ